MSHQQEFRESLVGYLRTELVGPESPQEVLAESPCRRYVAGILFPSRQGINEAEDVRPEETGGADAADQGGNPVFDAEAGPKPDEGQTRTVTEDQADALYDDTIAMANAFFPSAIGVSFICETPEQGLVVQAEAAVYRTRKPQDEKALVEWERHSLDLKPYVVRFKAEKRIASEDAPISDSLRLRVLYRQRDDGKWLATVSMYNSQTRGHADIPSGKECFFQAGFRVRSADGQKIICEYQSSPRSLDDPEEASLALLYRNRRAFAVGHGCAPEWLGEARERCEEVRTTAIPAYTVPPVQPRSKGGDELSMFVLSGADGAVSTREVPERLSALSSDYGKWIEDQSSQIATLPSRLRHRAEEHLDLCRACLRRIEGGIQLLRENSRALRAFMLANQAMLMQQVHSRRRRRMPDEAWQELPNSYRPTDETAGRWRTFQLAFLLMNLRSLLTPDQGGDGTRDVVDLIWFPTGGGKTEAYLGLTAYAIFLRRLTPGSKAGCTALMRYTLRLLTSQQFQRASSLICACELMRQRLPEELGSARITIGLWVGQSLTPNTRDDAVKAANGLARDASDTENPFQILTCPWCGTALDRPRTLGYRVAGTPRTVHLVCPDGRCAFSKPSASLPISVVDEDIYDQPPSLIIGTVDKFAMLAWRPEAGAIFGLGGGSFGPPDLIIQDELHLISGPLGSMVGLYETVIDLLSSNKDRRPKIVASTATIRRAHEQCRSLYDRKTFQFPPAGLDISDSFFAVENPSAVGRRYVGVFASGAPSFVTALVRTASALLQGCLSSPLPEGGDETVRDPYWTLLQYFSSLRELGRAATLVEADIPEYMWAIASRAKIPKEFCRHVGPPVELTSRRSAQEIPEILDRLKETYPRKSENDPRPIDTLLATNMISVGVDIDRLGLMAVVGQPKTTSEYIQASSRVGRSAKAPGLVVTLYNPGKPRDRSHYEHFMAYHAAFYKYVEPTSVTPFSLPVLERALHALLVIIARQVCKFELPNKWDGSAEGIRRFTEFLRDRVSEIDAEHLDAALERLEKLKQVWSDIKPSEWGRFGPPPDGRPLMYPAGTAPREEWSDLAWSTPSSLRNVDVECEARVLPMYPL